MGHRRKTGERWGWLLLGGTGTLMAACKDPPKPEPTAAPPSASAKTAPTREPVAPEDMVLVRAGVFTMGSDLGKDYERPPRKVTITRPFMIDKTEVTAEAYARCVQAGVCTATSIHGPAASAKAVADQGSLCTAGDPERAQHPINCVDFRQADAYCHYAGKRLPTEAEWEYAARGTDERAYPWGEEVSGCKQAIVGGCLRGTGPVGQRPENKSPSGAFDMAGNVWEWVSDGWDPAPSGTLDPRLPSSTTLGVLRGGGWDFSAPHARTFSRMKFTTSSGHVSTGMRCARDADAPVANADPTPPPASSAPAAGSAPAPEAVASAAPPPSAAAPAVDPIVPRPGTLKREASVAIIIGVEHYRRDLPVATGAATDAKLFADHAELSLGIPRRNIHVLVDSDATKSSIDSELSEWLARNATAGGDTVFFFAGHGAPDPTTGATYLVPWDADPKFIKTQGVQVDALQKQLDALPSSHVYAFLDSCFSGSGGRSVLAAGTRPLVREQALKPSGNKLTMFTATGPNEITGGAGAGGLFSHYLFRGMNGEADQSGDNQVTWGELAAYTAGKVADDARRENRDQHPSVVGLEGSSDVVLVKR
jgi:formylglycine-generating enzyme required for sulfatase activity